MNNSPSDGHNESLAAELVTVRTLFNDTSASYIVPVYQRNYAWGAPNIEQLIQDVRDAMTEGSSNYFLGNLVVTQRGSEFSEYEIVDGQQRLTTLHLLLSYLRDATDPSHLGESHAGRLLFEARTTSTDELRRLESGTLDGPEQHGAPNSHTGIAAGFRVIKQYFEQNAKRLDRDKFRSYLLSNVTLLRTSLPGSTDLNRYFEVMNTRGQQLRSTDIVKARLMSQLDTPDDRDCFAWIWDACSTMDRYVQAPLAVKNTKLRFALFGGDWTWLVPTSYSQLLAIYQQHFPQDPPGNSPVPASGQAVTVNNSWSLDEAVTFYLQASGDDSISEDESVRFSSGISFDALLMQALATFQFQGDTLEEADLDDKHLIERFHDRFVSLGDETAREFAFHLLRIRVAFDAFIVKREFLARYEVEGEWSLKRTVRTGSNAKMTLSYRSTFLPGYSEDQDENESRGSKRLLMLQSMLRITYTSPRAMRWITVVLHRVLLKNSFAAVTEESLIEVLEDFARRRVNDAYFLNENTFETPTGFAIPRIVFTYLDYLLLTRDGSYPKTDGYSFNYRTSIEHFYPQNPDVEQSGTRVGAENLHGLGNLALVSVSSNSKFGNSLPLSKALNFSNTVISQSPKLALMAAIASADDPETGDKHGWNDHDVLAHQAQMVSILRADLVKLKIEEGCGT